jgi:hypothetical protein
MKRARCHVTSFGAFRPGCSPDFDGYIEYHESDKYRKMSDQDLEKAKWLHRVEICRNAAAVEIALRRIEEWNKKNS